MADAKLQHDWDQTSWLTAAILSAAFGNKKRHDPKRLNPYPGLKHRRPRQSPEEIVNIFGKLCESVM